MENVTYTASNARPFAYINPNPSTYPFLIWANRMGCAYGITDFFIQRDSDYPFFTVHFILDGCGFFHVAGKDYLLKKGDAFLISAGEEHLYRNYSQEPLSLLWIELSPSACTELFQYFKTNEVHTIEALYTEIPIATLIKIQQRLREDSSVSPFDLSAMYYSFLVQLMESVSVVPKRDLPPLVTETLHYINQHLTEDIQICTLSKNLHVSHTYLTRTFRQYMGTAPLSYVNLKRLEYACHLLLHTTHSCEEIADKIGYYDASHFHRMFKKQFGCSPTAYRKEHTKK